MGLFFNDWMEPINLPIIEEENKLKVECPLHGALFSIINCVGCSHFYGSEDCHSETYNYIVAGICSVFCNFKKEDENGKST